MRYFCDHFSTSPPLCSMMMTLTYDTATEVQTTLLRRLVVDDDDE